MTTYRTASAARSRINIGLIVVAAIAGALIANFITFGDFNIVKTVLMSLNPIAYNAGFTSLLVVPE